MAIDPIFLRQHTNPTHAPPSTFTSRAVRATPGRVYREHTAAATTITTSAIRNKVFHYPVAMDMGSLISYHSSFYKYKRGCYVPNPCVAFVG
jgi:hypothetical protein